MDSTLRWDCRNFSMDNYKLNIKEDLVQESTVVFCALFDPPADCEARSGAKTPARYIVCGTSNGFVNMFNLMEASSSKHRPLHGSLREHVMEPNVRVPAHEGPTYGICYYGTGDSTILFSCGDDGRTRGWRWASLVKEAEEGGESWKRSYGTKTMVDLMQPQKQGSRGALSAIPEVNAIAADVQRRRVYTAAGDNCAYAFDVETGKVETTFSGHLDYLHCLAARPTQNQIVTGSEDGTARVWDCRSGNSVAVLDPWKAVTVATTDGATPRSTGAGDAPSVLTSPWVSSVAIDSSENWLVTGSGGGSLTVWSLASMSAIAGVMMPAGVQSVQFARDQIVSVGAEPYLTRLNFDGKVLSRIACAPNSSFAAAMHPSGVTAVGGYGGLVDVISEFGSHLAIWCCK